MDRLSNWFGLNAERNGKLDEEERHTHPNGSSSSTSNTKSFGPKKRLSTLAQIGEDWLYLALLGVIMAFLSFGMDFVITLFLDTRLWMFGNLAGDNLFAQYIGWSMTPVILVTLSTGFVHLCSPTAIGSGIPEMKTILRGVVLNEYLTFRTLVAKVVGLTFTLGSGLPLGKEGPFVHMASIVATLLSKTIDSFKGFYENESRNSEMLSAACAVGVAATFYAPIGGVLFSIEVTSVYFAVRSYWRGFFVACCGATIWRLLGFWFKDEESLSALFKTNFRTEYPFDPIELLVFAFIGVSSGFGGAAYIKFHREIVQYFRRHKRLSEFLQRNRYVYPILVTLIITVVTFPPFIGKYTASTLNTHLTIQHLFSNRTWSRGTQDMESNDILDSWTTPETGFYLHLFFYIVMLFWTSALASTIPIPSGIFIPVLKMGAAYGRLIGEMMHSAFPDGIRYGDYAHPAAIEPGCYAVVGAAAFSGAVTHTISTSMILFEMTGQIVHIIPVIFGVLISNAVCQSLQPSIYDSIIQIKKLPYLPPIVSSSSMAHKILVKDFMRSTDLAYIWKEKYTYGDLMYLLRRFSRIMTFPLVESVDSMKLLGSVRRHDLLKMLCVHLNREIRLRELYGLTPLQPRSQDTKAVGKDRRTIAQLGFSGTEFLGSNKRSVGKVEKGQEAKIEERAESRVIDVPESSSRISKVSSFQSIKSPKQITKRSSLPSPEKRILRHFGGEIPESPLSSPRPSKRLFKVNHLESDPMKPRRKGISPIKSSGLPENRELKRVTSSEFRLATIGNQNSDSNVKMNSKSSGVVVEMISQENETLKEDRQLSRKMDLSSCQIDEAPFQLVAQTSLYRVHTLFSMLGLNHAYVTSLGHLVGVVALKDIRDALEKMVQERF